MTEDYNSNLLVGLGIEEDLVVHCCPRMNTITKKDEESNAIMSFQEKMQDNEPPTYIAIQELRLKIHPSCFLFFKRLHRNHWYYIPIYGIYCSYYLRIKIPRKI